DVWQPRLEEAEVLFFGGGNTFHLMHWMKKSGLVDMLPDLLKTRVYAGISAGSCVAGPTIYNSVQNLFGEEYELEIKDGLGMVDLPLIPHLNPPRSDEIRKERLQEASKDLKDAVFALDDQSALGVTGDGIEAVSEGEWLKFN